MPEVGLRFFLNQVALGNRITSGWCDNSKNVLGSLVHGLNTAISFNDILYLAGANIVRERTEDCIDLSPEKLDKRTLIELIS